VRGATPPASPRLRKCCSRRPSSSRRAGEAGAGIGGRLWSPEASVHTEFGLDLTRFFGYPTASVSEAADEVLFLPDRSERDWEKLFAHTDARRFGPGDQIIHAEEVERALYIVTEGTLEMLLPARGGAEKQFKTIEAPTVIGELGFVDGGARSSTVQALTDGELRRLSYDSFEVLAAREPELARAVLFDISRILAQRLRTATSFIAEWVD
jgi:CRP/FNR family transcriptional regulator, cyclic AMP receptor protein